jgi:hypothetical protein
MLQSRPGPTEVRAKRHRRLAEDTRSNYWDGQIAGRICLFAASAACLPGTCPCRRNPVSDRWS